MAKKKDKKTPTAKDWDKVVALYLRGETLEHIMDSFPNVHFTKATIMAKMSKLGCVAKKRAMDRRVLDSNAHIIEQEKVRVTNDCISMFNTGAQVIQMLLANYVDELKDGNVTKGQARATAYNANLLMDGVTKIQKGYRVAYGMDENGKLHEVEPEVLVIEGVDNGKI